MPFTFKELRIPGLILVSSEKFYDERGFFLEAYKTSDFQRVGITDAFVQENHSQSKKDVLRGLHYQEAPMAQGKLVSVIQGCAWDVAVDLRPHSPFFLQWEAVELHASLSQWLYIPAGFAHGFLTLSDELYLTYKCTAEYSVAHERGIRWNDPRIGITWPINHPILSKKDEQLPFWQ